MGWKETDKIGRKERVYFQIREPGEGGSGNLPEVWNKYQDRLQGSFTVYGTRVAGLAELSRASKNNANKVAEAVKKGLLKLKEKHTYRGAVPPGNHGNLLRKLPKEFHEMKLLRCLSSRTLGQGGGGGWGHLIPYFTRY